MKNKIFILMIIIILILGTLSVNLSAATFSFTTSMTAKNSKVPAGSEVLITVKLSNLNVGESENGINQFSAYLYYDTNVFEKLTESSVDGVNSWVASYNTGGTGKISLYRPNFLNTDEEIMQISLKTKPGLADGTQGEVKLSTIVVGNSVDEISSSPVSTSITIGGESSSTVTPIPSNTAIITPVNITTPVNTAPVNTTPAPLPVNNTSNTLPTNNNIYVNNTNEIQVVNEIDSDMPYTGSESNALIRIIIGVIFIGLVLYIKIERMNKDIK